jgi:hypothetical protein
MSKSVFLGVLLLSVVVFSASNWLDFTDFSSMKLIYLQKFRCGSLAYIGSWSYNGVVQAADYVLLLDENSYLMRRHDGTVNYYVASFSGRGRFGLGSGGFMDIGVEVDGSKFYAVCEENKVYLGSFTNVKYVRISLADGIVTKVSEIEVVDSNNRVLKTYGCPFAPAWGLESAYSVAFMGGPLKVFNLSAYGSGPTIGVAEGFGRCPVFVASSSCGKWFGSPDGTPRLGFNELNGWVGAWCFSGGVGTVALLPGVFAPDSTGTGFKYFSEVRGVKVGSLSVYDLPSVVRVDGIMPVLMNDVVLSTSGWALYFNGSPWAYVKMPDNLINDLAFEGKFTVVAQFRALGDGVVVGYADALPPDSPTGWVPLVYIASDSVKVGMWSGDCKIFPLSDAYDRRLQVVESVDYNRSVNNLRIKVYTDSMLIFDEIFAGGAPWNNRDYAAWSGKSIYNFIGNGYAAGCWGLSNPAPFKGYIYGIYIYNRVLSYDEVVALYRFPDNPPRQGLVLWYKADPQFVKDIDGDGVLEWVDRSGKGHHGKIYGAQLVQVSDGDYLLFNKAPSIRILTPGSYELYILARVKSGNIYGQQASMFFNILNDFDSRGRSVGSVSVTFRIPDPTEWGLRVDVYTASSPSLPLGGSNYTYKGTWSVGGIYFWLSSWNPDRTGLTSSSTPYFSRSARNNIAPKWAAAWIGPEGSWVNYGLKFTGKLNVPWSGFRVGVWHDDHAYVKICSVNTNSSWWFYTPPRWDWSTGTCEAAPNVYPIEVGYYEGPLESVLVFVIGPSRGSGAYIPTIDGAWYCETFNWNSGTCGGSWQFVPASKSVPYFVASKYTPGSTDGGGTPKP